MLSRLLNRDSNRSLLNPILFSYAFKGLEKGKVFLCLLSLAYGFFLSIIIASTATHMTITIIIAATPSITVSVDARPVGGDAVGAGVAGGLLA